jgi:hypothetical protein
MFSLLMRKEERFLSDLEKGKTGIRYYLIPIHNPQSIIK